MKAIKNKQLSIYAQNAKKQQDDMVVSYLPAVKAMAYRLHERLPSSVDVNDLISTGVEELIKLSKRYDEEQNDNFWGYAKKRVYGSMLDFLRSLDIVSRSDRSLVKKIEKEIDIYFNEHSEEPDDEYLANLLGVEVSKVSNARNVAMIAATFSLDEQLSLHDGNETLKKIEKEDLIEKISNILSGFSQREQMIVQLYYFEELSLREISEILDISMSRISQINKHLMRKIRKELKA